MKTSTEIIINGHLYKIDKEGQQLKHEIKMLSIPFSALKDVGGWFQLRLNTLTDRPHQEGELVAERNIKKITLPAHILRGNKPGSIDYKHNFNKVSYINRWGAALIDDMIKARLNGKLPEVNVAGHFYKVDLEHHRLVDTQVMGNTIPFGKMTTNFGDDGIYHSFYYDANSRSIQTTPFEKEIEGIYTVTLPAERVLDPIGYSRTMRLPDLAYVSDYQVKDHHVADSKQLAKVVEMNRQIVHNLEPKERQDEESRRVRRISV